MAPKHLQCVSLPVMHGMKNYLEKAFKEHINSMEKKLQKTQKQWKDLVFKVEVLEGELRSSKDELDNLRSTLITEREKGRDAEENTQKLVKVIEELQTECARLEEKVVEFEEKPAGPQVVQSPPDIGVIDVLHELVSDTQSNFERWNTRQTKLEKEMEEMKEDLKRFTTPPSSVVGNCHFQIIKMEKATTPPDRSPPLNGNSGHCQNMEDMDESRPCGAVPKTRLQRKNLLRLVHGKGQPSGSSSVPKPKAKSKSIQSSVSRAESAQKSSSSSTPPRKKRSRSGTGVKDNPMKFNKLPITMREAGEIVLKSEMSHD